MGNEKDPSKHANDFLNKNVEQKNVATIKEVNSKIDIKNNYIYSVDDAYTGNPDNLLGEVYLVKSKNGKIPTSLNDENVSYERFAEHVRCKVDEKSKQTPILRNSIIVDKNLSLSVNFLSYLSAELRHNDFFSLMVYDQATGVAEKDSWLIGLKQWKDENIEIMKDESVFCIFAIKSYVQKNVIRKKYVKYEGKGKGGCYGININGELSTSTEEYSLDIRFGFEPAIIKSFPKPIENNSVLQNVDEIRMLSKGTKNIGKNEVFLKEKLGNKPINAEKITQRELIKALNCTILSKLIKK